MRVTLHPRQAQAFDSTATELLFGGAAGGGKSFLLRVSAIRWCLEVPGVQAYLFRRTHPDLRANHLRGPSSLPRLLAGHIAKGVVKVNEQKGEFRFLNGSRLVLAHCQHEADAMRYQGADIHVLMIDELTHFSAAMYRFLRARVRMSGLGVPERHAGRLPRIECATNPGGIGHGWVKAAWITPAEPFTLHGAPEGEGGMVRQYIPARLADNPSLLAEDPSYLQRLEGLGRPELVKALAHGDWDIQSGVAFEQFAPRHVIAPFAIPPNWPRLRAFDWGSTRPFSVGWWAVSDGSRDGIPGGALVRYREWYGSDGRENSGLRMTSEQVAKGIRERETGETIADAVADPAIFARHDGPSIAERMAGAGVLFRKADNSRRAGYQAVRSRIAQDQLLVFSGCRAFLATVPHLVMGEDDPEDIAKGQEDHIYDETRYACMARPHLPVRESVAARDRWQGAFTRMENRTWKTL